MRIRVVALLALSLAAVAAGTAGAAERSCPTSNPPNTLVLVGGSGQTAQLGSAFQTPLQVQLANTNGCAVTGNLAGINVDFAAPGSGASGVFSSTGSPSAVVGTNSAGVATAPAFTANGVAGAYGVDALSDFGSVTLYLTNTASGLAASIAATGGDAQEASVGSRYGRPLQARVVDAAGKPVAGATVTFAVVAGSTGAGGTFLGGQGTAVTDGDGVATSPPLLANASPGRFTVVASTAGLAAIATFELDNHAALGSIAAPAGAAPPARAVVESRYGQPLVAQVLDASGKPVEGASVTFALSPGTNGAGAGFVGGGSQATALTDASGRATSPPLVANKTAGRFTATATTASSSTPLAYTLENVAGPAHTVAPGAADGASTVAGTRFPLRLAVTVTDADGNAVPGALVTFAAPGRGAGGSFQAGRARLRVVRVRTDADGVAVAPPFAANRGVGGYVVVATAPGGARTAFGLTNTRR